MNAKIPHRQITFLAALTCASALVCGAPAQNPAAPAPPPGAPATGSQETARVLLKQLARNNDFEIALAEKGARKARNEELKKYSERLQRAQIQSGEKLKPIANQHGVLIDQSLTAKDERDLAGLEKLQGKEFDQSLAKYLLREQRQNLVTLEQATLQPLASNLKQYVNNTFPESRKDLQETTKIARELGVAGAAPAAGGAGQ